MKRNVAPMDYFGHQAEKQKTSSPLAKVIAGTVGKNDKEGTHVVEMDNASTTIVRRITESLRKRWAKDIGEK